MAHAILNLPFCFLEPFQLSLKGPYFKDLGAPRGKTENGTWGAPIKILRPLFNTNTPGVWCSTPQGLIAAK